MTTESAPTSNGRAVFFSPVMDFWFETARQAAEQTQALLSGQGAAPDPQAVRKRWIAAMAQSLELYLRSPMFLATMRRNFEALAQVQGSAEDLARDVARSTGIPRINDISGLFERMQIGQEAILNRLSAIEQRLSALEKKPSA